MNCLIAQANARGALGLDIGRVLAGSDIELVETIVDNVASERLAELADNQGH